MHIGAAPYGFFVADGQLCEAPGEQDTLSLLQVLAREGLGATAIAAELARRGHSTRAGTPFRRQGLARLLRRMMH